MRPGEYKATRGEGVCTVRGGLHLEGLVGLRDALMDAFGSGLDVRLDLEGEFRPSYAALQILHAAAREASARGVRFDLGGEAAAAVAEAMRSLGLDPFGADCDGVIGGRGEANAG